MPRGGYIKNHGERSDLRQLFSCVSHPARGLDCVGVVLDVQQSHFTAYCCLIRSLYQVPVIVLRDGVELNSFAVKLRFHRLPVYPAGVRGVDLSV